LPAGETPRENGKKGEKKHYQRGNPPTRGHTPIQRSEQEEKKETRKNEKREGRNN